TAAAGATDRGATDRGVTAASTPASPEHGGAAGGPAPASSPTQSIRVDVDKVDRLVNLVGELVITQAMLIEQSTKLPVDQYPALIQGVE
ncbi:hypothetical protein LAQ72_27600, partial [Escherichia coli]|nr:hypothetical protein [Escherichia coli]